MIKHLLMYKDIRNTVKEANNAYLARRVSDPYNTIALILDGDRCRTSKVLINRGVPPWNIWAPNIDLNACISLRKLGVNAPLMTVGEFIKRSEVINRVNFVYLDYTCTLWGANTRVINDMRFLLKRVFGKKILFATTLSLRANYLKKFPGFKSVESLYVSTIEDGLFVETDKLPLSKYTIVYKNRGTMMFLCYTLTEHIYNYMPKYPRVRKGPKSHLYCIKNDDDEV